MLEQSEKPSFRGFRKRHWVFLAEADAKLCSKTMTVLLRSVKKITVLLSGLHRDDAR